MSTIKGKGIPRIILAFVTIVTVGEYFIPYAQYKSFSSMLALWAITISAFLIIIGLLNILKFNFSIAMKKGGDERIFSIWFILLTLLTFGLGLISVQQVTFRWLFSLYARWSSCVQSMLAFFMLMALYRGCRTRTKESGVLVISVLLLILSNAPVMGAIWPGFSTIGTWINDNPVKAGQTGLLIGAALGAISTTIRLVLGRERGFLGEK